jgi:hypothetical protein
MYSVAISIGSYGWFDHLDSPQTRQLTRKTTCAEMTGHLCGQKWLVIDHAWGLLCKPPKIHTSTINVFDRMSDPHFDD